MGRCVDLLVCHLYTEAMEMRLIDRPKTRHISWELTCPRHRLAYPFTLVFSGANFHYLEALLVAWLRTEGAEGEINSRQKRGSLERLRPHQPQDFFPRPQCAELCASL